MNCAWKKLFVYPIATAALCLLAACSLGRNGTQQILLGTDPNVDGKGFGGTDPILAAVQQYQQQAVSALNLLVQQADPDNALYAQASPLSTAKQTYLNQIYFAAGGFGQARSFASGWTFAVTDPSASSTSWPYGSSLSHTDSASHQLIFNRAVLQSLDATTTQQKVFAEIWRQVTPATATFASPFSASDDLASIAGSCLVNFWTQMTSTNAVSFTGGIQNPLFSDFFTESALPPQWSALPNLCGFTISNQQLIPSESDRLCTMNLALGAFHDIFVELEPRPPSATGANQQIRLRLRRQSDGSYYEFTATFYGNATYFYWTYNSPTHVVTTLAGPGAVSFFAPTIAIALQNEHFSIYANGFQIPLVDTRISDAGSFDVELMNMGLGSIKVSK